MAHKKSELTVITKAKDLCSYVMVITMKSPKKFRFTLVSRMQNLSLDVVESLFQANDVFVSKGNNSSLEKRLNFQHSALTSLRLLAYISLIAREQECILPKQYEQISIMASECMNLLGAWINSDRKRTGSE